MNRLSALLDVPGLIHQILRQGLHAHSLLVEISRQIRELKGITMSYGEDVKAALLEMDSELDTISTEIDDLLEGVDDDTAAAIRERTARLKALHPQDEVPGVPADEPQPGAETGGDGTTPPVVEPSPETPGSSETQGL